MTSDPKTCSVCRHILNSHGSRTWKCAKRGPTMSKMRYPPTKNRPEWCPLSEGSSMPDRVFVEHYGFPHLENGESADA